MENIGKWAQLIEKRRSNWRGGEKMKRVLVTGAGGSKAINFVKSLRMAHEKIHVVGTDSSKYHIELSNCDKKYLIPPCQSEGYLRALNKVIDAEAIGMVCPCPTVEVEAISSKRGMVNARLFLPQHDTITLCNDKYGLNKWLEAQNTPVPESYMVNGIEDLEAYLPKLLRKHPSHAWLRAIKGSGSRGALPVKDVDIADAWIKYWDWKKQIGYGDFMLSEYLPGREFAFQSLWRNGELLTSQARERMEYLFGSLTASGQSSSYVVGKTVHDDRVNQACTQAVETIDGNADGVFCVDLKEDSGGFPRITEINAGRFFTTNNFLSEAGTNMPYYYVKLGYEEELPDLPKYNAVPAGWYWIRIMDGGHKLLRGEKWTCKNLD